MSGLRLTVLGSGTCELRPGKSSPAYLVRSEKACIILDLGQGALRRFLQAEGDPKTLSGVLVSHHHPDHLADLVPLLFALGYDPALAGRASLTLVAHPGVRPVLEGLQKVFGRWLTPPPWALETRWLLPGEGLDLAGVAVKTAAAHHLNTSLAYRLEAGGASLVYLGDSAAGPGLVELARGADLLIAHCAGPDESPKPGHLHPSAAGELAAAAGVDCILLSHLYRSVDPQKALESASRDFGGRVILAEDLLSLEVGRGRRGSEKRTD